MFLFCVGLVFWFCFLCFVGGFCICFVVGLSDGFGGWFLLDVFVFIFVCVGVFVGFLGVFGDSRNVYVLLFYES